MAQAEPTLIHWHGLTPPWEQDGVPDLPFGLLDAGETRSFRFPVGPGGTHWMHAHTLQEQNLDCVWSGSKPRLSFEHRRAACECTEIYPRI